MYVSEFSLLLLSIHLPWETVAFPEQRLRNSPSFAAIRGAKYQHPVVRPSKDAINRGRAGKCTKVFSS